MLIVVAILKLTCYLFLYSRANDKTKIKITKTKNIKIKNDDELINNDEITNKLKNRNDESKNTNAILFLRFSCFKKNLFDEISIIFFVLRNVFKIDNNEFLRNSIVIR